MGIAGFVIYCAHGHEVSQEAARTLSRAGYAAAGALGATIATFFTFLPSYLFILAAAPWSSARATT